MADVPTSPLNSRVGRRTHTEEVRRWLGEYALTWGWTLGPPTDASHAARLLVLKHGRRWSPGHTCATRGAT